MNHDLSLVLRKAGCSKVFSLIYDFFLCSFLLSSFLFSFSFFFFCEWVSGGKRKAVYLPLICVTANIFGYVG